MMRTDIQDNTLFNSFLALLNQERQDGSYPVIPVNDDSPHKVGCSSEGYPIFFIASSDNVRTSDIKLELFHVMFNRDCRIQNIEDLVTETARFNIFQLNSNNLDFQRYFFGVMSLVLQRLKSLPSTATLKSEISKIIRLFTENPKLSLDVIRGLWAELLVIERSSNPEYLIKAWHITPNEKYDFNDGVSKLEVKSTAGSERKHTFSLEQLNPEAETELFIASIFVLQTGLGKSVFDLVDAITNRISDSEAIISLREIVLSTIGPHLDEVNKLYFDYNKGIQDYALYDYRVIPSISKESVPVGVEKVVFQSDLSGCAKLTKSEYHSASQLFNSL